MSQTTCSACVFKHVIACPLCTVYLSRRSVQSHHLQRLSIKTQCIYGVPLGVVSSSLSVKSWHRMDGPAPSEQTPNNSAVIVRGPCWPERSSTIFITFSQLYSP